MNRQTDRRTLFRVNGIVGRLGGCLLVGQFGVKRVGPAEWSRDVAPLIRLMIVLWTGAPDTRLLCSSQFLKSVKA